jgi:hypothetical protein
MARYNEQIVTGDMIKYLISSGGYFYNDITPQITFNLDEITILPDKTTTIKKGVDSLTLTLCTPTQVFNLLDLQTHAVLGEATFQDVFVMLYSLFNYKISNRDVISNNQPLIR